MPAPRADFGKPISQFIAKLRPEQRVIVTALRKLVESTVPDATSSIKWGQAVFTVNGKMAIMIGAHKSHVNLVVAGPTRAFKDPKGVLEGSSKLGRHLKMTSLADLPRADAKRWIKTAAQLARAK